MEINNYIFLGLSLIFLYFSYEFTLMENVFLSLTSGKIKTLEDEDASNINLIKKIVLDERILSVALIGDYFSNCLSCILFSIFFYNTNGIPGLIISCLVSVIIIIVFGETVPKRIGQHKWQKYANKKAKTIYNLSVFFKPVIFITEFLSSVFIRIIGGSDVLNKPSITEDDLIDAVSLGIEEGIINRDESLIIENVIDFRDSYAKDIMTPRTDIIAINVDTPYDEIVKIIKEESFSRMPVYDEDLDDILGILNVKDLISIPKDESLRNHIDLLKTPFFTFEYKLIGQLFNEMRHKRISVAIVSDEYGGTEGMITTEDLIEKIVGSIADEYDEDEDEDIMKISSHEYLIDGSMNLDELNHVLNLELESSETDSIAGFIIENIDRFPEEDEDIIIENLHFHIEKASKNRIDKLILKL
ncbi:hemolysin family protein [Peptoniphilus stercorisuis]|uniref:Hemolysin n=1 Tax=Peptoniphilus stercorisuis TaxID=1436965 RepID=A0ABS4KDI3_9FIRM|nr:hemolysin family protein [Peptoniphilus stercorisuis]MBP2025326.1 putative hemolysin [Peptoniphilus stercorisuis]